MSEGTRRCGEKLIAQVSDELFVASPSIEERLSQLSGPGDAGGTRIFHDAFQTLGQSVSHSIVKRFISLRLDGDRHYPFGVMRPDAQIGFTRIPEVVER